MNKFSCYIVDADNLPEILKDGESWGDNYRHYLIIERDGKLLSCHSDGGEPEDNRFGRDWSWVANAIRQAYEFGVQDGKK
jgi:hypothetical protein